MSTMKAVQVPEAGGDFKVVELQIPEPGPGEVRIKVEACGICHSDVFVKEGLFPDISFPRVPGHEVVGTVDALGEGVDSWSSGQRVGTGWHGGHCFTCDPCRDGDFVLCNNGEINGITRDGGYAEYMVARAESLAAVPEGLSSVDAAPLLCAGITTYNALRNSGARPGDLVAVQGIGGLGHLGVQYAVKMGFKTVAISGGADKADLAKKLGAHAYIDYKSSDVVEELQKLGGARIILATAPNAKAISQVFDGLGRDGKLIVVGVDDQPLEISPMQLIMGRKGVAGWPSGTGEDSADTMRFSDLEKITPMVETYPLDKAAEAYDRMMANEARFRVVLEMS